MDDDHNPFEAPAAPPGAPLDDVDQGIRDTAKASLQRAAMMPMGFALLAWCFDPCFVFSFLGAAGGLNAIRTARMMRIGLEELYPEDAGRMATVMGWLAIAIAGGKLLLMALLFVIGMAGAALN